MRQDRKGLKKGIKTLNIIDYINEDFLSIPVNSKNTKYYFGKYICFERLILLFLIFSVFIEEVKYAYRNTKPYISSLVSYLVFGISIILVILMINKYFILVKYKISKKILPLNSKYFDFRFNFFYILETLVLFSQSFFFFDGIKFSFKNHVNLDESVDYTVNDVFHFISLLKIFIIFKIVIINTIWANDKSFRICQMYGCKNNFIFIIRCLMKEEPILFVFFILLIGIIYFGGIIRIVESPVENSNLSWSFSYILNCYWCIIITMTTVGYGDMYPSTNFGRFIIIVCAIFGITVISLMVVSITNTFEMSNMENKSFLILKRLIHKEDMKKYGARMINLLIKYKLLYKINNEKPTMENKSKLEILEENFKENIVKFKNSKRNYKSLYDNNVIEEIDRMNGNIKEKIGNISKEMDL